MQKEINPDLFGDFAKTQPRQHSTPQDSTNWNHVLEFDRKIADLRSQIQSVAEQFTRTYGVTQESVKRQNLHMEHFQNQLNKIYEAFESQQKETQMKFQKVHSQLLENKDLEHKLSGMVDRYQSVLKTFEVRIANLQKIIDDKDNQILSLQSLLTETKTEIARLKRI